LQTRLARLARLPELQLCVCSGLELRRNQNLETGRSRQVNQGSEEVPAARDLRQINKRICVGAERRMFWEYLPVRSSTLEMTMNKLTRKSLDSKPADLARQKSLE
jgi:hypothetical protein